MISKRNSLRLSFWGVRGSIPSTPEQQDCENMIQTILLKLINKPLKNEKQVKTFLRKLPDSMKYFIGGNTSCVYVSIDGTHLIFDAGSGIRRLGQMLMNKEFGQGKGKAHLFLSHTHWDHIMGFPFFTPAYIPGNNIIIYGVHNRLESRISNQQEDEYYPVSLSAMGANIDFIQLRKEDSISIDGIKITNKMLNHPGGSFGYRLDYKGKSVVYATDSEYKNISPERRESYVKFFQNADILIFDAQFTIAESIEKENWGHSTCIQGVELAARAKAKRLFFFHHDPSYSDQKLTEILTDAIRYRDEHIKNHIPELALAREGLEIEL